MTVRSRLIWTFVSLFFAGLVSNIGIELMYAGSKPHNADVASGRVIQLTINHGSKVYVSARELRSYEFVKSLTLALMLISVAGAGFLKVFGSKNKPRPQ